MARFQIAEGFGKHHERGRTSLAGQTLDLDRYDPNWHEKFEPLDDRARELKRCALIIGRKVRLEGLSFARLEAAAADRSAMRDAALADQRAQPEELAPPAPPPAATMPLPPPTAMQPPPPEPAPDLPPRRGPGRPPKSPPPAPPFRAGPPSTRRP